MSNVINLDEFRKKKECLELKHNAHELLRLIESLTVSTDGDPLIITVEGVDSDSCVSYTLDELYTLSDSDLWIK